MANAVTNFFKKNAGLLAIGAGMFAATSCNNQDQVLPSPFPNPNAPQTLTGTVSDVDLEAALDGSEGQMTVYFGDQSTGKKFITTYPDITEGEVLATVDIKRPLGPDNKERDFNFNEIKRKPNSQLFTLSDPSLVDSIKYTFTPKVVSDPNPAKARPESATFKNNAVFETYLGEQFKDVNATLDSNKVKTLFNGAFKKADNGERKGVILVNNGVRLF